MGWFLVTVVVPVIAPFVLLPVYWLLPIPVASKANAQLIVLAKDGQLCWAAMSFCVSALYEIAEPAIPAQALERAEANWANAGFIVMLLICAMLAGGGAVFPTPNPAPPSTNPFKHFATMTASIVLTLLAAGAYTVVHYKVSSP